MAVLFVVYIPIEDVSDPTEDDSQEKNKKIFEIEPAFNSLGDYGLPRVDSKQKFREVPSVTDIACAQQQQQQLQQQQQENNIKVLQGLPTATQQNEDIEYASESKPLLEITPKSVSPSKLPKSASSNVLMDRNQQQPQPQMTTTTTTTTLQSVENNNTLPKSFYREIPGSRFKVSIATENPAKPASAAMTTSTNEVAKFPRRESTVPSDMFNDDSVEFIKEVITLKEFLEDKLNKLKISNHVWQKTIDDSLWMISFMVSLEQCDQVFNSLTCSGFGKIPGTSLSIFPTSAHKEEQNESEDDIAARAKSTNEKSEFMKSIKSSLTVAQVVGAISNGAALTFDYLLLIFLASMIAGFGLAENSSVVLVASMLISPLMGPIIGFTFGIVIKNRELCKLSVRTELIGLSICLGYGFLFGLITGAIDNTSARYGADGVWPTYEMQARGMLRSLWVGIFIALPSGAGVALAILGGNTGSLVGVAISASLLPPLVNAGMLWGLACVSALNPPPLKVFNVTGNLSDYLVDLKPPDCVGLLGNSYKMVYSCTMSYEAAILGSVSLLLAILNIICIFFMGVIVMKVKELSPLPGATKGSVTFWKKDVPIMRHTYETIKGPKSLDMRRMAKELVKEIKQKNPVGWENIVKDVKDDPLWKDLNTGLEPKQDILQVMTEKNNDDDDFDQPKSNHFNRQPGGAFSSEHTEILLNDQRYQTISGNIAPFRAHIRDLFSNPDEESAGDLSQSASVATTPTASKMPIGGGGCIVRMRRTHHKGRPKSANDRKYSDSQALSYHNNNVSFVNGSSTAQQRAAEDEEEEEDEVLMLNYNKIAHFKKNAYNKKRATSIAYGASERSPGTQAASGTPSRMQQVRIRIDEGQNQTFSRDNSMT